MSYSLIILALAIVVLDSILAEVIGIILPPKDNTLVVTALETILLLKAVQLKADAGSLLSIVLELILALLKLKGV